MTENNLKWRLSTDVRNRASVLEGIANTLADLPVEKTFVVECKYETRTGAQNRYLHGCVYKTLVDYMRQHHGQDYSSDAIHEYLKLKFLPYDTETMRDGEVRIYRSTTTLTKKEFSDYVEHIMRWAAEFGCVIPEPDWRWQVEKRVAA